jgi:predicted phosphate transport protein (TIGR00153 family)
MRSRAVPDEMLLELFERAGANAERGAGLLRETLRAVPDASALAREVHECEKEGDRITHAILSRLAEQDSGRMSLDAADVHALAVALDDVVDFAEEAADQLGRYGVEAPMEQAEEIGDLLVASAGEVTAALHELRNGMDLAGHLVEIHRLENEADQIVRAAVAQLFAHGIDPMVVIRWKDIFETLEEAVDACERVANVLEGITLKQRSRR